MIVFYVQLLIFYFLRRHAFSAFGDLFIIIASIMSVFRELGSPMSDWSRLCLGVGALILCVNMTKYSFLFLEPSVSLFLLFFISSFKEISFLSNCALIFPGAFLRLMCSNNSMF